MSGLGGKGKVSDFDPGPNSTAREEPGGCRGPSTASRSQTSLSFSLPVTSYPHLSVFCLKWKDGDTQGDGRKTQTARYERNKGNNDEENVRY